MSFEKSFALDKQKIFYLFASDNYCSGYPKNPKSPGNTQNSGKSSKRYKLFSLRTWYPNLPMKSCLWAVAYSRPISSQAWLDGIKNVKFSPESLNLSLKCSWFPSENEDLEIRIRTSQRSLIQSKFHIYFGWWHVILQRNKSFAIFSIFLNFKLKLKIIF